jgi:hypothetical protein
VKRRTAQLAAAACGLGVETVALTHPVVVLAAAACPLIARIDAITETTETVTENDHEENRDAS